MEIIMNVISIGQEWLPAITGLIAACATIATMTPTKVDDKIIQKILDVVNFIGLNFLGAKNKDA